LRGFALGHPDRAQLVCVVGEQLGIDVVGHHAPVELEIAVVDRDDVPGGEVFGIGVGVERDRRGARRLAGGEHAHACQHARGADQSCECHARVPAALSNVSLTAGRGFNVQRKRLLSTRGCWYLSGPSRLSTSTSGLGTQMRSAAGGSPFLSTLSGSKKPSQITFGKCPSLPNMAFLIFMNAGRPGALPPPS